MLVEWLAIERLNLTSKRSARSIGVMVLLIVYCSGMSLAPDYIGIDEAAGLVKSNEICVPILRIIYTFITADNPHALSTRVTQTSLPY